jgi:hypothetical protein
MTPRTKIEFKVGNSVIFKTPRDLTLEQLDNIKQALSLTCKIDIADIEVVYNNTPIEMSEIDLSKNGLQHWKTPFLEVFGGIRLTLVLGSDEHLDAINNGTLEKYLKFF